MNDMLLAKTALPEGWIDMGIGEAHVVREELAERLPALSDLSPSDMDMSYQPAEGMPELREYLEARHGGKRVVVTNGAKQALLAIFAAAKDTGLKNTLATMAPYWSSFPRMAQVAGLDFSTDHDPNKGNVLLIASPNNPTGGLRTVAAHLGAYVVHDAAYWSQAYSEDCTDENLPDCHVRVYSMSKALGLSGLRVGYAVFEDEKGKGIAGSMRDRVADYVETSTSGVSVASQQIVLRALQAMDAWPVQTAFAHGSARARIQRNRDAFAGGLGRAGTMLNHSGMFAWCRKGPGYDPDAARVRVIDGASFGSPDCFRASLGGSVEDAREAGRRLGEAAEARLERLDEQKD